MPRDDDGAAAIEVRLAGGRCGKVIETITAGVFAFRLDGSTWIDRLDLSPDQLAAAERMLELFEAANIRPRVGSSYAGSVDAGSFAFGLENLAEHELAAWRCLNRLITAIAPDARATVIATVLWDQPPASPKLLRRGLDAVTAAIRGPQGR